MNLPKIARISSTEYVIKRKARKLLICDEGGGYLKKNHHIQPGEEYYEDHLSYLNRRKSDGFGYMWYHTHIVCEHCWRGIKLKA